MHKHKCKQCGVETLFNRKWNIARKVFPDLCKACSQSHRTVDRTPRRAKDWGAVFNDPSQTADTLAEAKQRGTKFYKHSCSNHGQVPYATLDNTCRLCTNEQAKVRNRSNPELNRPRVILASIRRRARLNALEFDLTLDDVRTKIPAHCPVLGIELSYDLDRDTSPSIDRLDNSKGYTRDNIRIISTRANRIKSDGTADEHLRVYEWMKREGQ